MDDFPGFLAAAMSRARLTPADLARATGVSDATVSRWRNGAVLPDIDSLRKVSAALRVPLLRLLVAAGHLTRDEAQLKDVATPPPMPVGVLQAIEHDLELIDEARTHLANQYRLLLRIQEPSPAASRREREHERHLRPVARGGQPGHAESVREEARRVREEYEKDQP